MKRLFLFVFIGLGVLLTSEANAQTALEVKSTTVTVSRLSEVLPFYTNVLPFKVVETFEIQPEEAALLFKLPKNQAWVKGVKLKLGNEILILQEFPLAAAKPIPPDSKSNDLWFQHIAIVVSDIDKAYEILKKRRVQFVSSSPQTLPDYIPAAAGIKAFYFRDPDGHNLELIYFPPGKGNPKWQTSNPELFLGIDHTAIGVSNTPKSRLFYEQLGLKFAGNSENYGPEQEHLNQVFGAHLEISGFVAQKGIGVEFLEYLAPPGGRPYPADSRPTDLWHWHTEIQVANLEKIYDDLLKTDFSIISKKIMVPKENTYLTGKSLLVRDPDGHALLLTEN